MAQILAALLALPKILSSILEIIKFFEKQFGPDWPKAIAKIKDAYSQFEKAKTDEEKDAALKSIAGSWSGKS